MRQHYWTHLPSPTYLRLKQCREGLFFFTFETTGDRAVSPLCYSTWDGWNSRHVDSMPSYHDVPHCTPACGNPDSTLYFHHTSTKARGHASRFLQPFTTVNSYRDTSPSFIRLWNSQSAILTRHPSKFCRREWLP